MNQTDVERVAAEVFDPLAAYVTFSVGPAENEDAIAVRVKAKAFDYYGVVWVGRERRRQSVRWELEGLWDQIRENILLGRAPHAKGYPGYPVGFDAVLE
jgi:hypothetical protein